MEVFNMLELEKISFADGEIYTKLKDTLKECKDIAEDKGYKLDLTCEELAKYVIKHMKYMSKCEDKIEVVHGALYECLYNRENIEIGLIVNIICGLRRMSTNELNKIIIILFGTGKVDRGIREIVRNGIVNYMAELLNRGVELFGLELKTKGDVKQLWFNGEYMKDLEKSLDSLMITGDNGNGAEILLRHYDKDDDGRLRKTYLGSLHLEGRAKEIMEYR